MEDAIRAAQQIAQAGKTPSVGLIKAKLPKGYPLPKIIGALKVWQDHPEITDSSPNKPVTLAAVEDDLDKRIQQHIATAVALLNQDIAELRHEIEKLKQNS
ncbi:hypothetical protein K6Y31_01790 [Motilimonas cestriensis]|uniref:KfrA N-terminal DNA-binding domain-containing protein n=1 Tax=Motilimonas cestriensis TaxID=2742685 RepID=A0ABS8W632_9GAMM|nr:hypothetical protein [Motilimonas cestriensis]MCE2593547.1 hypothetical protein [Motilimonas cestriensis]